MRNGQHLLTGRPFANFQDLRSREILGNWLICVALNSVEPGRMTFCSDHDGDGIILDTKTGNTWFVEHTMVPAAPAGSDPDVQASIITAIRAKQAKGVAYAEGKTLVIFLNLGGGKWYPNKIAKVLPQPLLFDGVWVFGLQMTENGEFVYGVTCLDMGDGDAHAWLVRVHESFEGWTVQKVQ